MPSIMAVAFLAEASGSAGETSPAVLGVPWGELVIGVVCFAVLVLVLGKFAWPMFEKAYADRTAAIEGGIAKAEQAQEDAAAALAEYKQQLAGAREEAARIREDAKAQAQSIHDDLVAKARAETDRIAAAGQAQLDAQRAQIVAELRADLGRVAVDLAGKIVGESLEDEARQRRTVDRFLVELEN
ncbi:MAG: F0F1 ATP synthase subunit B [Nakamurella sp.]